MDKKKIYITPVITYIGINYSVSMNMGSINEDEPPDPDDPGLWDAPFKSGSNHLKPHETFKPNNTFQENPFK